MTTREIIHQFNIAPQPKPKFQFYHTKQRQKAIEKYAEYKERLRRLAELYRMNLLDDHVLKVVFYIRIPASYSLARKEELVDTLHVDSPALNDYVEAVTDALINDKGINKLHTIIARKMWAEVPKIVFYQDVDYSLKKKKKKDKEKSFFEFE